MLLNLEQLHKKYNLKINGVIHIGAHHGQEHFTYKNLGINNLIYFEPIEKNFNVLKNSVDSNCVLYRLALGNDNKKVKMYVESQNRGMSSSILEPNIHVTQYPHILFNEEEEVDMMKLDDVNFDKTKYNMINIDVQGYELEVFKGGSNTLENIDIIISEINKEHLYKNGALVNELIDFLSVYGFRLVEETWAGGNWGDGLFLKIK